MSLFLISIFSFLAAVSLIVILFMLPMAVQDSPQARIKRRLTTIGRLDQVSRAEMQSILKTSIYNFKENLFLKMVGDFLEEKHPLRVSQQCKFSFFFRGQNQNLQPRNPFPDFLSK